MMSRRSVLVWCLVVGMWAASMGCVEGERSISGVEQQDHAIIGGEREPGYPAVGALIYEGEQFCTGTLVRPDVVITAAHCLIEDPDNPEAISFFIGPDPERLDMGRSIAVASLHIHPDYDDFEIINDFAVMRLAEEVTDVDTIPYLTDPMNETFIGRQALFIGYGLTSVEPEEVDGKQSVWITITEMDDTTFTYSEPGVNTCSGDSGGPALLEIDGTMTLIGVTSWGDEDCAEFGVNTRVDAFKDYIQQVLDGDAPPNPDGTGSGPGDGPGDGSPDGEPGDVCQEEGWYNDGVCDDFCDRPDPDCEGNPNNPGDGGDGSPDGEPGDVCQEEGWYNDGVCDDFCDQPDPDCGDNPGGDGEPGNGMDDHCEEGGLYDDGVCDEDCARPDPDCTMVPGDNGTGGSGSDVGNNGTGGNGIDGETSGNTTTDDGTDSPGNGGTTDPGDSSSDQGGGEPMADSQQPNGGTASSTGCSVTPGSRGAGHAPFLLLALGLMVCVRRRSCGS